MTDAYKHYTFLMDFLDTYYAHPNDKYEREIRCTALELLEGVLPMEPGDLLCGRQRLFAAGFFPQRGLDMGYFIEDSIYEKLLLALSADERQKLEPRMEAFRKETSLYKLNAGYPKALSEAVPSYRFQEESGMAFYLCRMSGSQLDYEKLVRLGICGLLAEISEKERETEDPESLRLYTAFRQCLGVLSELCKRYAKEAKKAGNLSLEASLLAISERAPEHFLEAAELVLLYALAAGSYNYGRMDTYLGDFLVKDLESGALTWGEAKDILISLWKLIGARNTTFDGRVIVGGKGRKNEKNANLFAKLAIMASHEHKDILPQLTLRFYEGQDKELMELALDAIGDGAIYPMLYNDDVNVPSVEKAFRVPLCEAEEYTPYGCGEYVLNHRSYGTPSGLINLLKVLEVTLFDGVDPFTGEKAGLSRGGLTAFRTFDELWEAYKEQAERLIEALALQEAYEYRVAAKEAGYLFLSMLYDDCIARGKPIFDGGIRYLGGTLESYGNVNAADSLTAIRELVYEKKLISKEALLKMLMADFKGYEKERELLLNAPKYGNDNDMADEMLQKVHEHVCLETKKQAKKAGLHSYLIVVINNSANTTLGERTIASADGRKCGEPMANANNPSGGSDREGITAFLNSIAKPKTDIHAGAVQNMKFSKEMFKDYLPKTRALLETYFEIGGAQAMINVLSRGDLEAAVKNPEKYQNLIVRVGGFSARFVALEPKMQQEIISRTMY